MTACASSRLDTIRPDPDSEAAATIMIAELISMATPSDTMVSLRATRIAMPRADDGSDCARSASEPECRYRLCGIKVAPRMPRAIRNP
ncbi:hypothetical protein D3C78_1613100 [compost metagenome]